MIAITRGLDGGDVGTCNDCQDRNKIMINKINFKTMRFNLCNDCLSELEKALMGGKNAGK